MRRVGERGGFRAALFVASVIPGTFFGLRCLDDSADLRRTTMINPFVSPLFEAGEVLLVLSITMFVAGLIATYGDRLRWRRR
jgi:hypothetical protein